MKKVMSLLTITVRSSLYKILLILFGMSVVQLGMFYRTYLKFDYSENSMLNQGGELLGSAWGISWTLESLVEKSNVVIVFLAAFALICLVLTWAESERKGSNTFYFYERLAVDRKQRVVSLTLYNLACFLLLIFVEVLTVLGMGIVFEYLVPSEYESVQMYFMAFYKSDFLHCLFPMTDIFKWIRNGLIFISCAMEIAVYGSLKKKAWSTFLWILMILFGFVQKTGTFGAMDIILILAAVICLGLNIYKVWWSGFEGGDAE